MNYSWTVFCSCYCFEHCQITCGSISVIIIVSLLVYLNFYPHWLLRRYCYCDKSRMCVQWHFKNEYIFFIIIIFGFIFLFKETSKTHAQIVAWKWMQRCSKCGSVHRDEECWDNLQHECWNTGRQHVTYGSIEGGTRERGQKGWEQTQRRNLVYILSEV